MKIRRSKAQWQELVDAHANSGLSQRAFCEQQGISVASFGYWKRKLKANNDHQLSGDSRPTISDGWLELPLAVQSGGGKTGAWHIELDLGNGVCLRLRQDG